MAAQVNKDLVVTLAPISEGALDFIRSVKREVEQAGGSVTLLHLKPSVDTLEQRVIQESRHKQKIDTVARLREVITSQPESLQTLPDFPHLEIDNSNLTPNESAQLICDALHHSTANKL